MSIDPASAAARRLGSGWWKASAAVAATLPAAPCP